MRRVMLLVFALGMGSWMFAFFWHNVKDTHTAEAVLSATAILPTEALERELPFTIPGTDLNALHLVVYDGPFGEDGSGDEVIGVTALVIQNDGEEMIEKGEVTLQHADGELHFAFGYLPPGKKLLVLERDRKEIQPKSFVGGSAVLETFHGDVLEEQDLAVEEVDMITLALTNRSTQTLNNVYVYFKTYDSPSDMYVGGNTHVATVGRIVSGGTVEISPYGYVQNYSKIVAILCE